jgi:multicomponent Na+:H+ antiporter subunit E
MGVPLRFVERLALFVVLWWVLAEGDGSSWVFGVPFALFASVASLKLTPRRGWRIRPLGALRFAAYFAYHSIVGGVDVAVRAVRPSLPIHPGFVVCPLRLPGESARVLLADVASLLPGTLSSGFEGDSLVLHVLDCRMGVVDDVRRTEEYIARALGLELRDPSAGDADGTKEDGDV